MSYPDFPPGSPDPYRDGAGRRSRDDGRGWGAGGQRGSGREARRGRAPSSGGYGPSGGGYGRPGRGQSGERGSARWGEGRPGRASGRTGERPAGGRRGGGGAGEPGGYPGPAGRGGRRGWPGRADRGGPSAASREESAGGDQHRDFWAEADSVGRGFGRRREARHSRAGDGAPQGGRVAALRDRYRNAVGGRGRYGGGQHQDEAGWGAGRPRGLAAVFPFLARRGGGRGGSGGWDGRGRARRKGDWWRRWTWKKALSVAAAAFGGLIVIGSVMVGVAYAHTKIPSMRDLVNQSDIASTVYFSNGKPIGTFGQTTHVVLTYNQIPQVMRDAMVAAEDKNFYHEGGVSFTGILRAAYYDLTSSGGNLQGASTITEELVKQAYEGLSTQATSSGSLSSGVSNKFKEILIAEKLSKEKSKQWILTEYLNSVYFGDGATGVGAAAEAYFGIPASKLDVAQAAMLAAMVQQPSVYSPNPKAGADYTNLVNRWRGHVLATMAQMGTLPAQEAAKLKFPAITPQVNTQWKGYRGYIMQRVLYELASNYYRDYNANSSNPLKPAFDKASVQGLKIYTTYNERLTNALYATVAANQRLMRQCAPPAVAQVGGGYPESYGYGCDKLPWYVDTGAVLIQPSTGDILAEYGGPDYNKSNYDYAMESYNQVGSSFKPYVLASAIQHGMNAMNSIMNGYSPLWIPPVGSPPTTYPKVGGASSPGAGWYQVINDDSPASQGPVSVQHAMAASLNTAYTSLYSRVGGAEVMKTAQDFGVYTGAGTALASNESGVGEALGQGSLTVLEQATMIATIANNGTFVTPHAIARIVAGPKVVRPAVPSHQVLTEPQAAEMDWAMSRDLGPGGTAPGDNLPNGQVAIAKTGTTNLAQSAFFLGATPRYAMAVGMFVKHPVCPRALRRACNSKTSLQYAPPMGHGMQTLFGVGGLAGYGGGWPATIWHDFFTSEFSQVPVQAWPTPPNTLGQKWNLVGKLPKKHKPKPKQPGPSPSPGPTCHGNLRKCPTPSPSPSPSQSCPAGPCPSPTTTTRPPFAGVDGQAAVHSGPGPGSAVAGTVLVGGIAVMAVPIRRRRRRRRRG